MSIGSVELCSVATEIDASRIYLMLPITKFLLYCPYISLHLVNLNDLFGQVPRLLKTDGGAREEHIGAASLDQRE
jgi:hypothetical protein